MGRRLRSDVTFARDPITSLQNPRVKQIVRLRERRHRDRDGVFIAEGVREVSRALSAGLEAVEAYICPSRLGITPAELAGLETTEVTEPVLAKMAYRDPPEGVLAVFQQPERTLASLPVGQGGAIYLVLVGTEKPGNLGAMIRTAAAAGCAGVLVAGADVDLWNPNCLRNSTGAIFDLPTAVAGEDDVRRWLETNCIFTAAAVVEQGESLWTAEVPSDRSVALMIGPEHAGLDDAWTNAADVRLTIPTARGVVDSLNASTAAAVLLFELVRRRT